MTENEYIIIHDLASIRVALSALRQVIPESNDVIENDKFKEAMQIITRMEISLAEESVKITTD